jgi:multisubunit Na+/H+ antiporter MnhB subunit
MQPPFHVTGDLTIAWIIFGIGFIVCLYWLRALRLAREGARLFLRNLAFAVLVFCGCVFVFAGVMHWPASNANMASRFVGLIVFFIERNQSDAHDGIRHR